MTADDHRRPQPATAPGEEPARAHRRRAVLAARDLRRRGGASALARRAPVVFSIIGAGGIVAASLDRGRPQRAARSAGRSRCEVVRPCKLTDAAVSSGWRRSRRTPRTSAPAPSWSVCRSSPLIVAGIALRGLQRDPRRRRHVQAGRSRSSRIRASSLARRSAVHARRSPTRARSMSSATNLAVFLPFLDDNSFLARLLGSIDLFFIWWMVSLVDRPRRPLQASAPGRSPSTHARHLRRRSR